MEGKRLILDVSVLKSYFNRLGREQIAFAGNYAKYALNPNSPEHS